MKLAEVASLIQDNELFDVVVGFAVLVFICVQFRHFQRLPKRMILLSAYGVLFAGWVVTVLEGMFWPSVLNITEHICYALGGLLFSLWCWAAFQSKSRNS